jgi:hypothetical protein
LSRHHSHSPEATLLGQVIAFDREERALWPVEDMRRMLRVQLAGRLDVELAGGGATREQVLTLAEVAEPRIRSLAELLHHPRPPVELLVAAKDYAKLAHESRRQGMSPEIALVLYFAAIASALVHRNERISSLDIDDLRRGVQWGVRQCWLDEPTRGLLLAALDHLRRGRHLWRRA